MFKASIVLAVLASLAQANPVRTSSEKRWTQSVANCQSFYADIYAKASNINLEPVIGPKPANQQVLVQSEINTFAAGSTVMQQIAAAPHQNVSGTYSLYFEYCEPQSGTPSKIFQTHHGIVGNAGYWNVLIDGVTDYSFVESAAQAGWATLSYDRLGAGNSSHPDGIQVVQESYEIAQSTAIAEMLRNGGLSNLASFSTVVGVGHSYGSNLLAGLVSSAPNAFDAIVLTGFTNNATQGPLGLAGFDSTIAAVAYPNRFGNLGSDYVITPSVSADQKEFFHYPNYTQSALDLFTTTKSEYSLGQQNTIGAPLMLKRPNWTKPTFVQTGQFDAPYCAANCYVTSLGSGSTQLDTARTLFPSVADSDFATYVVPGSGHAITFSSASYDASQKIVQFVSDHGL